MSPAPMASPLTCTYSARRCLMLLLAATFGLTACQKQEPAHTRASAPTRCQQEIQNCPNPAQHYCSKEGVCVDHPTGEGCPNDWSWFKPHTPLVVNLPRATVAWSTTLPSDHNPTLPCAQHPALKDYHAWARAHSDSNVRSVAKAYAATDAAAAVATTAAAAAAATAAAATAAATTSWRARPSA